MPQFATTHWTVVLSAGQKDSPKGALFEALKDSLTGDRSTFRYAERGGAVGLSEGAVKVAVHRLRRRYRELLRLEIANTVATPEEVDEELRYLFAVLAR